VDDFSNLTDEQIVEEIKRLEAEQDPAESSAEPSSMSTEEIEKEITASEQQLPEISPVVSGVRKFAQGGFPLSDELAGGMEAAGRVLGFSGVGSKASGITRNSGPTLNPSELMAVYEKARDQERQALKVDSIQNPKTSMAMEFSGMAASPLNKLVKGMSGLKAGAAMGGIYGFGQSESDNVVDMAADTAMGVGVGGLFGKFLDPMTAPKLGVAAGGLIGLNEANKTEKADTAEMVAAGVALGLGAGYGAKFLTPYAKQIGTSLATKAGEGMRSAGDRAAFKALGGSLADFRNNPDFKAKQIGRWLLDNGLVRFGDTVESIAGKAQAYKDKVGLVLDDVYTKAEEYFARNSTEVGFNPRTDKAAMMAEAKKNLGFAVDTKDVLRRYEEYLNFLIQRFEDPSFTKSALKYSEEKKKFLSDVLQYRKDLKAYRNQIGSQDIDQALLPGFVDDGQRTGSKNIDVELHGQPPKQMVEEPYDVFTQNELTPLPQRPPPVFNEPRGDDLLPVAQQMRLDQNYKEKIGDGYQSEVFQVGNTPRAFGSGPQTSLDQQSGQGSFSMPPTRPTRPAPQSSSSPREAQDIKIAMDDEINYLSNPFLKQNSSETAFSAGRRFVNDKILNMIQSVDDSLRPQLENANKEYGLAATASRIATDKMARNNASNFMGITDTMAAGAAGVYSITSGNFVQGLMAIAAKKGFDHYGRAAMASIADSVGRGLLRSPEILAFAKMSPAGFQAMVLKAVDSLPQNDPVWQMALPNPAQQSQQIQGDPTTSPTQKALLLKQIYSQPQQ